MSEQATAWGSLRDALYAWVRAGSAALAGGDIPGMLAFISTTEGGYTRSWHVPKPDYYALVTGNRDVLRNLPETDAVLAVVRAFPLIGDVLLENRGGAVRTADDERLVLVEEHLLPFAFQYLLRANYASLPDQTVVADEAFAQTYDLFAQALFAFETVPVQWLVQFDNLLLEVDDVELEAGVVLRRPTDRELNQAHHALSGSLPTERFDYLSAYPNPARSMDMRDASDIPDVVLAITDHRQPRGNLVSNQAAVDHGQRLLTALRLVQSNDVGIHSIWHIDDNPFGRLTFPRWPWSDPRPADSRGAQAVVTPDVERQVRELWPALANKPDDTLALALRRLNDSYHRSRLDDRHIDYWIALEALFLREEEGELKYRAALLTARFIGKDLTERLAFFDELKKSYVLRSKIVHGAKPPKSYDVPAIISDTGTLLRRVLRACVRDDGHSPDLDAIRDTLLA